MAITQFVMVEELASLIKDNLSCKHLVLATEEALINFLQDETSPEGILELQPMSPYQRLLLHRLADIYGFAHESVGEGDDRHLVLERCPETVIPSILVSDILWQYDGYQAPMSSHNILRRKESPEQKMNGTFPSSMTLEEREAAYQAARERIFSLHEADDKEVIAPKSRNIPVVARRMIAHALGQKILSGSSDHNNLSKKFEEDEATDEPNNFEKSEDVISSLETRGETITKLATSEKKLPGKIAGSSTLKACVTEKKGPVRVANSNPSKTTVMSKGCSGKACDTKSLEKEQIGAAKRIFAHALGLPSGKGNHATTPGRSQ
ncbi:uncharacterized protein M6B38_279770 [Iris pallida]|uniref:R3H domain-containing protein n=1 Tax=Iris pallida TaxID=29817 RepID=A0AAX6HZI7_IRIPA|nr:uncharacterized protein M6B38_279770 [Iris pallida]